MKKMLLVFGGAKVGDTLHMLPYIYEHQDYEITWITGTYEREAAQLIQKNYPNITDLRFIDDGVPQTGYSSDMERFRNQVNIEQAKKSYDKVETRIDLFLDLNKDIYRKGIEYLPSIKKEEIEPYICYQGDSVASYKRVLDIDNYVFPKIKGVSIGRKGERIVRGTEDRTGLSLEESAKVIKNSILFVGIHSAMSCLNLYLNHAGICLHFTKGLLKFGDYNKNIIDVLRG